MLKYLQKIGIGRFTFLQNLLHEKFVPRNSPALTKHTANIAQYGTYWKHRLTYVAVRVTKMYIFDV